MELKTPNMRFSYMDNIETLAMDIFRDRYALMESETEIELREAALLSIKAASIFHQELEKVKNARIPVHILHEGPTAPHEHPTA
jgi:hypothetical protein